MYGRNLCLYPCKLSHFTFLWASLRRVTDIHSIERKSGRLEASKWSKWVSHPSSPIPVGFGAYTAITPLSTTSTPVKAQHNIMVCKKCETVSTFSVSQIAALLTLNHRNFRKLLHPILLRRAHRRSRTVLAEWARISYFQGQGVRRIGFRCVRTV